MVYLWTDMLVWFLVIAAVALIVSLHRQQAMQRPLRQLHSSPLAMACLTLLLCFALVGLSDSVHFKNSKNQADETISLLDLLCSDMRLHVEKTYSAPFSAYLFAKENIELINGSTVWDYPRLQYGGKHLMKPDVSGKRDRLTKIAQGLWPGIAATGLAAGLWFAVRRRWSAADSAVWGTLASVFGVGGMMWYVSAYYHVLGTDKVGMDILYQSLKSIRTGLVIGTLTTLIMLPFAIAFGIMAGFFKGWIDDAIQFVYTTLNSIPSVLLIAASVLMVQVYMNAHAEDFNDILLRADMRLLFLCIILGVTSWTGLCRLLRAETLKLREMEYVLAARALGVSSTRILLRHILPNVLHIVLISVVLDFSSLVLAEAVLSYINIGVDPTMDSWGNMINSARLELARDPVVWWPLSAAFLFMFTLVLSANLFADRVRDAFDPRSSQN
jgi:peptide/nickel transport system permease protein